MKKGPRVILFRSKNTVSDIKNSFNIVIPVQISIFHKSLLSLLQIKGGPTCGNSLETFCWTQREIRAWSSGRIGQKGCSAFLNPKRWHSYGERRRITAAWPTRNSAGPWGKDSSTIVHWAWKSRSECVFCSEETLIKVLFMLMLLILVRRNFSH